MKFAWEPDSAGDRRYYRTRCVAIQFPFSMRRTRRMLSAWHPFEFRRRLAGPNSYITRQSSPEIRLAIYCIFHRGVRDAEGIAVVRGRAWVCDWRFA